MCKRQQLACLTEEDVDLSKMWLVFTSFLADRSGLCYNDLTFWSGLSSLQKRDGLWQPTGDGTGLIRLRRRCPLQPVSRRDTRLIRGGLEELWYRERIAPWWHNSWQVLAQLSAWWTGGSCHRPATLQVENNHSGNICTNCCPPHPHHQHHRHQHLQLMSNSFVKDSFTASRHHNTPASTILLPFKSQPNPQSLIRPLNF